MSSQKRHLHHVWRRLRPINAWIFLGLAVLFAALGVYAMRQNNLVSLRLRDEVIKADEQNVDVETPLRALREHIYSHMNADLSNGGGLQQPIQLKYRYERLVAAEKAKTESANGSIYTQAQAECEKQFPAGQVGVSGRGRISCIEDYVSSHGVAENTIPDALYKFDFVSPVWSPDLAGLSLLLAVIFLILFVVRFTLEKWFQHRLKAQD
jgi:hypothetical protein